MASIRGAFSFMENLCSLLSGAREKLDYVSCIRFLAEIWHLISSSPSPRKGPQAYYPIPGTGMRIRSQGNLAFYFHVWFQLIIVILFICLESFVTFLQAQPSIAKYISHDLPRTEWHGSGEDFQNAWPPLLLRTPVRQLCSIMFIIIVPPAMAITILYPLDGTGSFTVSLLKADVYRYRCDCRRQ